MSPIDIALSLAKAAVSLIMLYIIGVIGYSLYLFFNPDKGRPSGWYWPDFINEWIGTPKTFSVATSNIAIGTDLLDQIINVASAADCMSNCNINIDCIGFLHDPLSNTCNTFSIISGLIPQRAAYANVYIVDGNEPKGFIRSLNMGQNLSSNIASYISTDLQKTDCAANCAANVTCTGFMTILSADFTSLTCKQQTDPTFGASLISMTNTDSYTMGDLKLPSSDNGYIS
jgi:hypothetical protein